MGRYRSAFPLPFPRGWDIDTFEGIRFALIPAVVGLLPTVVLIGWLIGLGTSGAQPGDYPMVAIWAPIVIAGYVYAWRAWPRYADVYVEAVTRDGESALSIPLRPPTRTAAIATGTVGALLIIGGAAILVRSFGSDPSAGFLWFAGLGMAGLVLVVVAIAPTTTVRDTAEILLTPAHLRIDDGEETIVVDWDDISGIRASHQPRVTVTALPMVPGANLLAVLVRDPAVLDTDTVPVVDDRDHTGYLAYEFAHKQFATDPLLTYHALMFYWRHPRLRAELGTEAAMERFLAGRFENTGAAAESES
ncbi:hypothetical protein [Nocardia sp. NPDC050406]|uniref:hypothetical protein n=1 Tax=Nocardia sp. NPDC050406 TaxID=3364318 RepID=UPI00379DEC04